VTRIASIGAGSVEFTKNLLTDIFAFPELRGARVALHDIDPERLETPGMMARWTSEQLEASAYSLRASLPFCCSLSCLPGTTTSCR
jgi:alpha-galactosidase